MKISTKSVKNNKNEKYFKVHDTYLKKIKGRHMLNKYVTIFCLKHNLSMIFVGESVLNFF